MSVKTIELDEDDIEITRYEKLTAEEIRAELEKFGIDPQPTIDRVKALVSHSFAPRRLPRRK
jgi:hypothetical protein